MIRSIIVGATALSMGLGLTLSVGCAGGGRTRWIQPGTSDAQLQRDQDDCMSKATIGADPGADDPQARATVARDFDNCMRSRGWSKAKAQ
ncbi:MAG: hypothetical protein JRF70_12440 [Deltaproteobacteria bacterium]|nr:hypothetical protein [Deltaproteobacteria bacterium]MBW2373330.1 hypothetical protein [Deltaproteobacteria bacterium]